MGTGGSAPTYCDAVTQVLGTSCGGFVCHGSPGRNALVYIDLVNAPDEQTLGEYLVGRRADYTRVSDADSCPTGSPELLIDPQFPERSLILTKVLGTQACGDNMPSTGSLSPAQIECLTEWVSGVAAATPPE
jgi:hypothetical protein